MGGLVRHPPAQGRAARRRRAPAEVADALRPYRDAGFAHPILVFRTPFDLETMDRLPELRARLDG